MGGAAGHVWDLGPPGPEHRAAYADAAHAPFWLDRPEAPAPADPLEGKAECDLAIVGGGLSGLWAAVLAKEDDPERDVVLVEGAEIAHAASGRNGGLLPVIAHPRRRERHCPLSGGGACA